MLNRMGQAFFVVGIMPSKTLVVFVVLCLLFIRQEASTAYAALPANDEQPMPPYCDDRSELASVMQAEGGAQPLETQIALMQIVKREADSRGLTVCALTRLTNFVTVRHYADAHPNSWTAAQFRNPHDWALDMAEQVMLDQLPDMTNGAGHWDGDGQRILFRP